MEDVGAKHLDKEIRELEARVRTSTDIDAELLPEPCAVAGTERRNTRMCPTSGLILPSAQSGRLLGGGGNRLETEVDYGLPLGVRFVGTPRVRVRTSEYWRNYWLGYGVKVLNQSRLHLQLGVDAEGGERPVFQLKTPDPPDIQTPPDLQTSRHPDIQTPDT